MSVFQTVLQQLRKDNHLTQQELANKLCMHRSTLAMYESGAREPSFDGLITIANYFNVSVDYLLGRCAVKDPGYKNTPNLNDSIKNTIDRFDQILKKYRFRSLEFSKGLYTGIGIMVANSNEEVKAFLEDMGVNQINF